GVRGPLPRVAGWPGRPPPGQRRQGPPPGAGDPRPRPPPTGPDRPRPVADRPAPPRRAPRHLLRPRGVRGPGVVPRRVAAGDPLLPVHGPPVPHTRRLPGPAADPAAPDGRGAGH